jgi:histidinol-phosphatase
MSRTNPSVEDLLRAAVAFATEAGRIASGYFRRTIDIERKTDNSPVTVADREAEQAIRGRIREHFPDHGILGEEFEPVRGDGDLTWVIDPIDGTQSFIAGVPLYGVLVAVVHGAVATEEPVSAERSVVGVVHLPGVGETLAAGRGLGCTLNGRTCRVSSTASLGEARVVCSDFLDLARREPALHAGLTRSAPFGRTWGDAFGYRAVATGMADCMIDPVVSIWDIAPMPVIIEEAGGRFSSLNGDHHLAEAGVATNGVLHDALLELRDGDLDANTPTG